MTNRIAQLRADQRGGSGGSARAESGMFGDGFRLNSQRSWASGRTPSGSSCSGRVIPRVRAPKRRAARRSFVTDHGRSFYEAWGDPGHTLTTTAFTAQATGDVLVQLTYGNGAGGTTTGITCATKLVRVEDSATGAIVASGYAVMPQRGNWDTWGESSFVRAKVTQGKTYRVVVADDTKSVNMSAFSHFSAYTGGTGGSSGPFYRVNIADVKVLGLAAAP